MSRHEDEINRIKAERQKTIRLANVILRDMLNETFDAEALEMLARHQAYVDVMTNTVPWEHAPAEITAKFVKQPTASDDEFTALLEEARKGKK